MRLRVSRAGHRLTIGRAIEVDGASASHAAWLAARRRGVTGSDVAPILGESVWGDGWSVAVAKRRPGIDADPTLDLLFASGHHWEGWILDQWERITGRRLLRNIPLMCRADKPWMLGTLDAVEVDSDGWVTAIVDAKSGHKSGLRGRVYELQLRWYQAVFGGVPAKTVGWTGSELRPQVYGFDGELAAALEDACQEWWEAFEAGEEFEPGPSDRTATILGRLHPAPQEQVKVADLPPAADDVAALAEEVLRLRSEARALDEEAARVTAKLALALGDAPGALGDGWRVRRSERPGKVNHELLLASRAIPRSEVERYRSPSTVGVDVRRLGGTSWDR